ncbi:MAG TPA: methyltransferase, partial [Salegentibacter sp.]|nr:methyltransferase [Salegentibacter sp.]
LLQPVFLVLSGLGFLFILLALLQLNTNLSPFPKPKDNATLITSGVYKYVRHPIYSGILIALFFLALYLSSPFKIFIVLLLVLLFWYKSKYEEEQLCLKYPDYSKYRQHTGRFLPKLIR